jgi:hypothetical protein
MSTGSSTEALIAAQLQSVLHEVLDEHYLSLCNSLASHPVFSSSSSSSSASFASASTTTNSSSSLWSCNCCHALAPLRLVLSRAGLCAADTMHLFSLLCARHPPLFAALQVYAESESESKSEAQTQRQPSASASASANASAAYLELVDTLKRLGKTFDFLLPSQRTKENEVLCCVVLCCVVCV